MKLKLLDYLDHLGIVLECDKLIRDCVEIICDKPGVLTVGPKSYTVTDGKQKIFDHMIVEGPNKVTFTDGDGKIYFCGTIYRQNRFLSVSNPLDELTVKLAVALEEARAHTVRLEERLDRLEKEYGINLLD